MPRPSTVLDALLLNNCCIILVKNHLYLLGKCYPWLNYLFWMKRPTNRGIFIEKEKSGVGYERKEKGDDLHDHNFYEGICQLVVVL